MVSLAQIEADLTAAMKQRDATVVDALRGLKTRLQNERIAKQQDLTEADIVAVMRSEIKKRKEAAESFTVGNRPELAQKERQEAAVFEKYLPPQVSEEQLVQAVDELLAVGSYTAKDFGSVMGQLKTKFGSTADGALLAKVLKAKLK